MTEHLQAFELPVEGEDADAAPRAISQRSLEMQIGVCDEQIGEIEADIKRESARAIQLQSARAALRLALALLGED